MTQIPIMKQQQQQNDNNDDYDDDDDDTTQSHSVHLLIFLYMSIPHSL